MKLLGWFIVGLLVGPATAYAAESKSDKDIRECKKAPPVMKHPADLKKARQDAFNTCMAGKGYAVGKIRQK
jgi:hypothetical protein